MNIALIGYGKMGKEIERIAISRNHTIGLIIDESNQDDLNSSKLQNIDVAIEFTRPESAFQNYNRCFESDVPVVSGTTGWLDKFDVIEKRCADENKGFFYASNFSLGVNLFFRLNQSLAKLMKPFQEYDVEMEEVHHTQKLDAPSGTAITLAEGVFENNDIKDSWVLDKANKKNEIAINAVRRGDVPGIHTIKYESEIDYIEITHSAKTRAGFALGAVLAAEYMKGKNGLHNMNNLLDA